MASQAMAALGLRAVELWKVGPFVSRGTVQEPAPMLRAAVGQCEDCTKRVPGGGDEE